LEKERIDVRFYELRARITQLQNIIYCGQHVPSWSTHLTITWTFT